MSFIYPTRRSAYGLRIAVAGREEWVYFTSIERLARDISLRLYRDIIHCQRARQKSMQPTVVSGDGTLLQRIKRTSVQPEHSHWGAERVVREEWTTFEAFSPNGHPLKIKAVVAMGDAMEQAEGSRLSYRVRHCNRDYCGYGPVPGIRKLRGGNGYMRRIRTTAERRLNELVLKEEGEVAPRGARCGVPNSWDDFIRHKENCWKSQTKGRKSWDRRHHGENCANLSIMSPNRQQPSWIMPM